MTSKSASLWFLQLCWYVLATVVMAVGITILWNWVFGLNYSLWFGVAVGVLFALTQPLWTALETRQGLNWLPDRRKYKQRLAELKAERERLARDGAAEQ